MSGLRSSLLLLVLAAGSAGAGTMRMTCAQPRVDPKTGDVVDAAKQALAEHVGPVGKDAPHGCAPAGGPKVEAPTQPTPAPEPEKPAVVAKSEPTHREQPIADPPKSPKAIDKTDTDKPTEASNDKKPTAKPAV